MYIWPVIFFSLFLMDTRMDVDHEEFSNCKHERGFVVVSNNQLRRNQSIILMVAFSSLARIWGECSTIHSPPALFFFFFPFFEMEISSTHLIHSVGQDQSTVAQ